MTLLAACALLAVISPILLVGMWLAPQVRDRCDRGGWCHMWDQLDSDGLAFNGADGQTLRMLRHGYWLEASWFQQALNFRVGMS